MMIHNVSLDNLDWIGTIVGQPTQKAMQDIGYGADIDVWQHKHRIHALHIGNNNWAVLDDLNK